MRIIWGLGRFSSWKQAASVCGHMLIQLDPQRPLDAFYRDRIECAVLTVSQLQNLGVQIGLQRFQGKLVLLDDGSVFHRVQLPHSSLPYGWLRYPSRMDADLDWSPVCDWPPEANPYPPSEQWRADVAFVGKWKQAYEPFFARLMEEKISFSIYGNEQPLPFAQAKGTVTARDLLQIYPSSSLALDLEGSPEKCLTIQACGGVPCTVGLGLPFLSDTHPLRSCLSLPDTLDEQIARIKTWLTGGIPLQRPIEELQRDVIINHTCVRRMEQLTQWLN